MKSRKILLCSFAAVLASTCAFGAYVTDGLVLRYDAIDNAGVGTHSDSPKVWADLSGNNHDLTLPASGMTVGADTMTFDHVSGSVSGVSCLADPSGTPNLTLEVVCAADETLDATLTSSRMLAANPRISLYFRQVGAQHVVGGVYYDGSNRKFAGAPVRRCDWNSKQFICRFHTYSLRTKSSGGSVAVDGSEFAALQTSFYNDAKDLTDTLTVGMNTALYKIKAVRLYSRYLTEAEAAQNAAEDEARFSIKPAADAKGNANVFDDAAFYFRAARQALNAYLDDYEFANALYIGSAWNPAGDTFNIGGDRASIMVETMDVPAPYAGKTLRNRSVVHFKQPYTLEDMSKASTSRITIDQPVAATNKASYTVMLRFKVESRIDPTANTQIKVIQLGYGWSGQSGLDLQLCGPADNLYVRAYHGSNVDDFTDMQSDSSKTLKIGEWVDMAITVSGRVNKLYYKTENGSWYEGTQNKDVVAPSALFGNRYKLALGGPIDNGMVGVSQATSGNYCFRGWYQQVAVWDRALSRDEVLNAFRDGCAEGDDWKVGVANDMSLEFAGSGAATLETVNDWRNMKGELAAANASVNVNFDLDAATFAKTRTFKFKTTSVSASGTFDLSLNGRTVAENVASTAGQSAVVTVPGGFFASGANTLTVTRTDSNSGKMEIDCMSLVVAEGNIPVASVVDGDPFAGAYRWYRHDGEAFCDVLRTAYPNSSAHKWTVKGPSDNIVHTTADVVCPYRGVTLPGENCMYFRQESYTNANGVIYGKGGCMYASIFPISNAVAYTAFARFKIDSFQNPTNCRALVFGTGYDWTGSRGMGLTLQGTDPENLYVYLSGGRTNFSITDPQSGETKNRLAQGKWIDIAVVVSNNYGQVYACAEGGDFQNLGRHYFGSGGAGAPSTWSGMYIGHSSGRSATSWSSSGDDTGYFRGWVHQAAVWPCALSEDEVKAVFGFPSPDVVRIGVENGSAAEFYGSGAASYTYPANADFRDAPSVIAAGGSLTVTFDLPATEVKNQLLKIAASPESVAAAFTVAINGRNVVSYDDNNREVTEFSVIPGASASFGVLAEYLRNGVNTMTITRTDSNAGSFSVDALSFGNGGGRVRIGRLGLMLIVQ